MIIKLIVALHLSVSHSFRGPEGEGRTNSGQMKQMSPDLLLDPLFHDAILQRGFNEGGDGGSNNGIRRLVPTTAFCLPLEVVSAVFGKGNSMICKKGVYIQLTISQSMPALSFCTPFPSNNT